MSENENRKRWRCVVTIDDTTLNDKLYWCFKEICDELSLSYQQVSDISVDRKNKFKNNKFRYAPQIKIEKVIQT
jgi:exoribonuclease II